jgi:hypothetical protein
MESRIRRLEDLEEIRALKAQYCLYCDGGWPEQGNAYMGPVADLFVEDGIWDASPALPIAKGRDQIRRVFEGFRTFEFAMHNVTNPIIKLNGDSARGRWHILGYATMPDGNSAVFAGIYEEEYVRTAQGWRYQSLHHIDARQLPLSPGWKRQNPTSV